MPLPGAKYRVTTTPKGAKIRLAFVKGQVQEAKNLETGATHTPAEFKADRKKSDKLRKAMMGNSSTTSTAMR